MADVDLERTQRLFTRKEFMTQFYNQWLEKLCANLIDFERAKADMKKNPKLAELDNYGRAVPISVKVENMAHTIENAIYFMGRFKAAAEWTDEEFDKEIQLADDYLNKPKLDMLIPK